MLAFCLTKVKSNEKNKKSTKFLAIMIIYSYYIEIISQYHHSTLLAVHLNKWNQVTLWHFLGYFACFNIHIIQKPTDLSIRNVCNHREYIIFFIGRIILDLLLWFTYKWYSSNCIKVNSLFELFTVNYLFIFLVDSHSKDNWVVRFLAYMWKCHIL